MERLRHFALPAYLMLGLLFALPLVESLLTALPLRLDSMEWRFGAAGMLSRNLLTAFLAVTLFYGVTLLYDHRKTQRVLAVFLAIAGPVLLAVAIFFVLDSLQMRGQVVPEMKRSFDIATVGALAKLLIMAVLALIICVAAFRSSREPLAKTKTATASPLLNRATVG
jgi:hypothetical protein